MEVHIEEIATGTNVTARIVLQGNNFTREIARLSLSLVDWADFTRCLHEPPLVDHRGRLVFTPRAQKKIRPTGDPEGEI